MRIRFNPHRAAFFGIIVGIWLAWCWAVDNLRWPKISVPIPVALDQRHTIAALAVLCITAVGIVKLLRRR